LEIIVPPFWYNFLVLFNYGMSETNVMMDGTMDGWMDGWCFLQIQKVKHGTGINP